MYTNINLIAKFHLHHENGEHHIHRRAPVLDVPLLIEIKTHVTRAPACSKKHFRGIFHNGDSQTQKNLGDVYPILLALCHLALTAAEVVIKGRGGRKKGEEEKMSKKNILYT